MDTGILFFGGLMKRILLTFTIIIVMFSTTMPVQAKSIYSTMQEEYNTLFCDLETIDDEFLEEWYESYKELVETYSIFIDREYLEDWYTDEEIQLMYQVIETECYQASFIQKVNVANVILNRVQDERFYGSVITLITSENQFDYRRTNISEDTKNALAFAFEIKDTVNGCIGFRSDIKTDTFNSWEYVMEDGAHYFYR